MSRTAAAVLIAATIACGAFRTGHAQAGEGQVGKVQADVVQAVEVQAEVVPYRTFVDARGIGVDPLGMLYVADAGRDVVVKMDVEGRLVGTLGGPGSREGAFDEPSAVDPTNGLVLYVADSGNRRLQLFSRAEAFLGSIPLSGANEERAAQTTYRRFDEENAGMASGIPIAVATSTSNEIFAVDADRRAVVRWTENRRPAGVIGGVDAGPGALVEPVDLWVGPGSLLYVADRGIGSVVVFDQFGTFVRSMGSGMVDVRAVTVDDEAVYVALPQMLVLFDHSGRLVERLQVDTPEPIVDLAAAGRGALFAVSSRRAYRLHISR